MTTLFAYIDMSTGSLLLQLLAMSFMSVFIFFQQVKAFILGLFGINRSAKSSLDLDSADVSTIKLDQFENAHEEEKKAA